MQIDNNTLTFPELSNLGVKNIATFNNKYWGNLSLSALGRVGDSSLREAHLKKLNELLGKVDIESDLVIYMGAEHLDNIRTIDSENLPVILHSLQNQTGIRLLSLNCDGFMTKEKVPFILAPADCAGIVMTAIDKKDGKRFVIFLHIGLSGALLNLPQKAIKKAHYEYEFNNSDVDIFIFPYIDGGSYLASENSLKLGLQEKPEWNEHFIKNKSGNYEQHFIPKVVEGLNAMGVQNIRESGLNTYKEAANGNLFSYRYAREHELDNSNRFGVLVSL